MGKGNGGTRQSSSGSPRGLNTNNPPEPLYERSATVKAMYESATDLERKSYGASDSTTRRYLKDASRQAYTRAETQERKEQRDFYGTTDAVKVIRQMGVSALQERGTSIRGYRVISRPGYRMDEFDSRSISFNGIGKDKYDSIVNALREKGFSFRADDYSNAIGYGGVGRIWDIRKPKNK